MNMTGEQRYAQRLEAQRIFDDKTAALAKSVQTDKMLRENFSSDDRVVQRRIGRQAKQVGASSRPSSSARRTSSGCCSLPTRTRRGGWPRRPPRRSARR